MQSLSKAEVQAVLRDPRFTNLLAQRARLRWGLTSAIVFVFFGFVLMIAFARDVLATKVGTGLAPLGFYLAVGLILFVVVITGWYVNRASVLFGKLNQDLLQEIAK